MSRLRIFTVPIFLFLSAGVYGSWYTADIFPWLHFGAFLSVCIVVGVYFVYDRSWLQFAWSLVMLSVIGVVFRAPMVLFTGTLSSNDPEKYALFARLTLHSGSYQLPDVSFYGVAGGFHTYIAQTAAVAGITPEAAIATVPILFGLLGPLVAASYCLVIFGDQSYGYTAALVAAAIGAVAALSLRLSYVPIAQSMGTLLLFVFLLATMRHLRLEGTDRYANWVVLILLLFAMALSHKLPVVITSLLLLGGWVSTRITTVDWLWTQQQSRSHIPASLVLLSILISVIQQVFVTSYISSAFRHSQATAAETSVGIPDRVGAHPDAAAIVDTGMLAIFESHSHAPVTLAVAGIAWLVLMWVTVIRGRHDHNALPIAFLMWVGGLTSVVLLSVGGAMSGATPNPMRFQVLQEPLLAALIGAGFVAGYLALSSETNRRRLTGIVVVTVLVVVMFHSFAGAGAPDFPGQERQFLTDGEVTGKEFTYDYVETTVWTDDRLQRQTPHRSDVTDKGSPWAQLGASPEGTQFRANNFELLQGTATEEGFDTLLYRPQAQTISSSGIFNDFRYEIAWDVERSADQQYHRAYDNGHAITYRSS